MLHLHHTKYSHHAQPWWQAKQLFHTFDVSQTFSTFTQYMSVSHGHSTIGGIEYDDGGCVEKTKKGESLTSTRLINGLWRCPSIDVNARSRDCHATDALRAISVWKLKLETKWVCIQLACSWRPRAFEEAHHWNIQAKFYNEKFPLVYESDKIRDSLS